MVAADTDSTHVY